MRSDQLAQTLEGLVGWLRPVNESTPCALNLPESLTESRSGLFVSDLNELLTPEILKAVTPEGEETADFLERITADVLRKLVGRLLTEQSLSGKTLLNAVSLLGGPGQVANTVNGLGRFVGFRLNLRAYDGVTMTVPRIGLQFDKALPEPLTLYVYSTSQDEPLRTIDAPYTRPGWVQWVEVAPEPAEGEEATEELNITAAAGENIIYIGYYESDLPGDTHAIRKDFTAMPCGCSGYDPYDEWSRFVWPKSISVRESVLPDDRALFFNEDVTVEQQSFGLNLELTAICDVVGLLSSDENQGKAAEAVQLALALRLMESIVVSPEVTQVQMRPDIQADALALKYEYQAKLYGGKEQGTDNYYPSVLKTIAFDLSGLDKACGPPVRDRVSVGYMSR